MKPTEFATHVRYKTRTNSTTFTDTDILALMKIRQDEIAGDILKADEDILLIPFTDGLMADQREYSLSSEILSSIKRVEAKLDGSDFIRLDEKAMSDVNVPLVEDNITNEYSNLEDDAFFFISRKAIYILSGTITTVASGLKVYTNTYPAAITDLTDTTQMEVDPSTTTHGVPRALHEIWARGVIIDYKESREKPIPLSEREKNYEKDKQIAIEILKRANRDRDTIGYLPGDDERWNEGYDL